MTRKTIIPTIALVAIMGAVAMGTMTVNAQSNTYSNLVTKIAQRFNLQESDVQQVVDQVRTDHQAQMQANWEARLSQLVADGKITDTQKALIETKHTELQQQMQSLVGLSVADRRAKMQQISADLDAWAKANNIDLKLVGLFGMHAGFGRGFRMGYWAGKSN